VCGGGGGGGGGGWKIQTVQEFFSAQGNRRIFFSCKSAAQDIFFPIYFAALGGFGGMLPRENFKMLFPAFSAMDSSNNFAVLRLRNTYCPLF
jgi:hypothetical protein